MSLEFDEDALTVLKRAYSWLDYDNDDKVR